jgi:signal transduction histidine kinase
VRSALPCQHVFHALRIWGTLKVVSRRVLVGVRVVTVLLVAAVVGAADWSGAAASDPARILFLGPRGVLEAAGLEANLRFPIWLFIVFLVVGVGYVETGLALWRRRPDSQVGILLAIAGLLWLAHGFRRSSDALLFSLGIGLTNAFNPVLLHLVLCIPAGRLRGRGDRALVIGGYAYSICANVGGWLVVDHQRLLDGATPRSLLLVTDSPQTWDQLQPTLSVAAFGAGVLVLSVLIIRYVRGSPLYRYAFGPMWLAGLAKVTGNLVWTAGLWVPPTWAYLAFFAGSATVPIAAAISVARSQPKELAMTRVVLGLGQELPGASELRDVLRRSTNDPTLEVVRFDRAAGRFATLAGTAVDLPTEHGRSATTLVHRSGQELGALIHDSALSDSPEVLRAVEQLAGLVLENERLLAQVRGQLDEVRESRRRIVEAGDTERARVERNMHDAVQQRLVAAVLLLRRADRDLPRQEMLELLRDGADGVNIALGELRNIVRGLHPQVVERGLVAAIESISERAVVPIRLTSELGAASLPQATAVTAYYVIAEGVTNAEKYARATMLDVRLELRESFGSSSLFLSVHDDGVGGAVVTPGGGLAGLRDRVEAYGGSLTLASNEPGGTRLSVALPLDPDASHRDPP